MDKANLPNPRIFTLFTISSTATFSLGIAMIIEGILHGQCDPEYHWILYYARSVTALPVFIWILLLISANFVSNDNKKNCLHQGLTHQEMIFPLPVDDEEKVESSWKSRQWRSSSLKASTEHIEHQSDYQFDFRTSGEVVTAQGNVVEDQLGIVLIDRTIYQNDHLLDFDSGASIKCTSLIPVAPEMNVNSTDECNAKSYFKRAFSSTTFRPSVDYSKIIRTYRSRT